MASFTWATRRALFGGFQRSVRLPVPSRSKYIVLLPEVPEDTAESNPLLKYTALPEYNSLTGEKCFRAIGKLIIEFEYGLCKLEDDIRDGSYVKTFESVMDPLERLVAPLDFAWSALRNLYLINKSRDIEEAYNKLHLRVQRARAKKFQSLPIYHAVKELLVDKNLYNEMQHQVIQKHCLESRLMGIDLSVSDSKYLGTVLQKIASESAKFREKLSKSSAQFKHSVDGDIVKHLPDSLIKKLAVDKLNPTRGPWRVTLEQDIYDGFMQYCGDRLHRWNVWNAYNTRASFVNQQLNNSLQIEEIRSLRKTQADILGYKNFAELAMETKMAGTVGNVQDTIKVLSQSTKSAAEQEVQALQEFCEERGFKDKLELWDMPYWRRKQRQALYRYDDGEVRQYFPFPKVLSGLFKVLENLFGIIIQDSKSNAAAWHPDVKAYDILDSEGKLAGSFILDPYIRPNKHYGAWVEPARNRSKVLGTIPMAYAVFNFPAPLLGNPSLLSYQDVCNLVGKFGHVLQHCLTRTECSEVSGLVNVEWDLVEMCPNLFQLLLSSHSIVTQLSGHTESDEPISVELHSALQKSRNHMVALDLCFELYYSALDLELYTRKDYWGDLVKHLWPQLIPRFDLDKRDCHLCSFTPIITDVYPAAFFSFFWSKMIAADVFTAFQDARLQEGGDISHVGKRFKETFLESGGGCKGSEVFRRFMGRDPSPEALVSVYALSNKKEH
ncbi:uncharacterized protein LOC135391509 [Ornithodoros turicata]